MSWSPESLFVLGAVLRDLRSEGVADLVIPDQRLVEAAQQAATLPVAAVRHKAVLPVASTLSDLMPGSALEQRMAALARRQTMTCMKLANQTVRVAEVLEDSGSEPIMLKGVALAAQTTGRVESRGPGDIDALVARHRLVEAQAALRDAGAVPITDEAVSFRIHATTYEWEGVHIDLHHRLARSPFLAAEPHEALLETSQIVGVGGSKLRTLGAPMAAVYMAISSGMDIWSQIVRVGDQARLFGLVDGALDSLEPLARRWHSRPMLSLAIAVVRRIRSDLPKQSPASESLASQAWQMLARDRLLRLEHDAQARSGRQVYQMLAARYVPHAAWSITRNATRSMETTPSSS